MIDRLRPRPLIAAALLLIGAGAIVVSLAAGGSDGTAEVVTGPAPVNEDARDLRDISAHNSPTLAADPKDPDNLALANRIDGAPFGCALHVSFDGGVTWRNTSVPFGRGASRECFAPDVAFGADGELYFSYVTLEGRGNVPEAAWVARSTDGGRTLTDPVRVLGPLSFQVRLAADPVRHGRVFLTYLDASSVGLFQFPQSGNAIRAIRSDDGGRSWSEPVRVSAPERQRVVAGTPAVSAEGNLIVLYLDLGDDFLDYRGEHRGRGGPPYEGSWQLIAARSEGGRGSFEESVVEEGLNPSERFLVFIPPFPSLALDRSGDRAYAAYQEGREGDADVMIWSSDDGGGSWEESARISGGDTDQYRPQVAVAPDGRVDVVYYDRRGDPRNVRNQVSFQSSPPGADHFGERLVLTDRPFDSRIGFGFERNLADLGSRLALLASDTRALAVWADTRGGTRIFPKQDLPRVIVAVPDDDEGIPDWARIAIGLAGVTTVAAALFLVIGARRSGEQD